MRRRRPRRRPPWQKTVIAVAVLYVAMVVLHVSNGFSVGDSFGAIIRDARAVTSCPWEPKELWTFITRSSIWLWGFDVERTLGSGLYDQVCDGEFRQLLEDYADLTTSQAVLPIRAT